MQALLAARILVGVGLLVPDTDPVTASLLSTGALTGLLTDLGVLLIWCTLGLAVSVRALVRRG